VKEYVPLIIWAVVIGAGFLFLWRKGYLLKLSNYWSETVEELKKCAWPSVDELKGSTVVIMVTLALLGAFTACADYLISSILNVII